MVENLHKGQPEAVRLRILHQHEIPGVLQPVLQGGAERIAAVLAGEGHPAGLRTAAQPVPGHAGFVQRLQVAVYQHAGWEEAVIIQPRQEVNLDETSVSSIFHHTWVMNFFFLFLLQVTFVLGYQAYAAAFEIPPRPHVCIFFIVLFHHF